jgi:hypothetical protein
MKLRKDEAVKTMFSIFGQYSPKGPIDVDASLVRFVKEIHKSLIRPRNYEEIRVLLEKLDE